MSYDVFLRRELLFWTEGRALIAPTLKFLVTLIQKNRD